MTAEERRKWLEEVRESAKHAAYGPDFQQGEWNEDYARDVPALLEEVERLGKERDEFAAAFLEAESGLDYGGCWCGGEVPGDSTHKPDCLVLRAKAAAAKEKP